MAVVVHFVFASTHSGSSSVRMNLIMRSAESMSCVLSGFWRTSVSIWRTWSTV